MFVIMTYDVNAKRTGIYRKLLRRYLGHEQFSVFFGDLTPSTLEKLHREINKLMVDGDKLIEISAVNRHNVDVAFWSKDGRTEGLPTVASDVRHKSDSQIL